MSMTEGSRIGSPASPAAAKSVAVIDIGTASIRMAIAEIQPSGSIHVLERLSQSVGLGKDTFIRGFLTKATIEECVRVLRSYRRRLEEYQIAQSPQQVRVVATSAVSEAQNRLSLVDRIYSATGFQVEVIDAAELHRAMYLGIRPLLEAEPVLRSATALILEVGGGSTDLLVLRGKTVLYTHTYRLGSLRLRETLEAYRAPVGKLRRILESDIERTLQEMRQQFDRGSNLEMVALGGDVRFAATQLLGQDGSTRLNTISLDRLQRFTDRMFRLSEDELVHKFHLAVSDAESLAPALLTYCEIARGLGLDKVHVSEFNLRAALLTEMAVGAVWTEDFTEQIVRSALDLAHKFHVDEAHATHVAQLSRELFHQMQDLHQLEPRSALVLYLAALLHEVGMYVNDRAFHKHSLYVINNSHLFGLGSRDVLLVALVARYHRRGSPKPIHQGYSSLDRADRIAVAKMAAILRIADSLDASRSQRIKHFVCASETDRFVVNVSDVDDLSLEQLSVQQKGPLFEEVFGVPVLLRRRRVS